MFDYCINSILAQRGSFTILYVDDCSDYTRSQKLYIKRRLHQHIVIFNSIRKYSIRNAYETLHSYVQDKNSIIINVDGDDRLIHDRVLLRILDAYQRSDCLLTYGNCEIIYPQMVRVKPARDSRINLRYPARIEKNNEYRKYYFLPLHIRTWSFRLFERIQPNSFLRSDGSWQKTCEDQAMMLPMLEMAGGRYEVIPDLLYEYTRMNGRNDDEMNKKDVLIDEVSILKQTPYTPI